MRNVRETLSSGDVRTTLGAVGSERLMKTMLWSRIGGLSFSYLRGKIQGREKE